MNFPSTRGLAAPAALGEALAAGLAPDGGLYVPETLPQFSPSDFDGLQDLPSVAAHLLRPFFADDPLAAALDAICSEAFAVEPPLRGLGATRAHLRQVLHGPTPPVKDYRA
ncbi:MAG: threonine synthase, partial [Arenimonas sp.]|nr:threonine synthase [Arenimonas sp.]